MNIPGFVDLQVNGYLGVDFSDPELTVEAAATACRSLLRRGTAAFLPTLVTSPPEVYRRNLPLLAELMRGPEFAGRLLGFHLEGPFISQAPGAVGVHDPRWVREPDGELLRRLAEWAEGRIRLLTLAPELPGAVELTRAAAALGITVSVGHTLCTAEQLRAVREAGAAALTHLGNGVPAMLPRHENPIWAGLAEDALTAMLVADGHHLPAPVLKSVLRAKGAARCVVVSDAAALSGQPPGRYRWNGAEVVLEPSGRLHMPARGCLAGSAATMLQCMNHLAGLRILDLDELLEVGFFNPALLIGCDPAGIPKRSRLGYDSQRHEFFVESDVRERV